jgi:hypothetical protein
MATLAEVLRQAKYVTPQGQVVGPRTTTAQTMSNYIRNIIPNAAQNLVQQRSDIDAALTMGDQGIQVGDRAAFERQMAQVPNVAGIVAPKVVNQLGMATTLPTDDIFKQAVANTPTARITDEGLYINLMRKQKPEQAMTESVRSGVFYLPEGSASMKHYGGTSGYGGTEKITGETLYKNPFFVKGATGGKAPQNAYDQILGKGSYEAMRQDALKVRHPDLISDKRYNLSDAITPEQFLEKYAPDLKGYGDYIFRNSRQGNQLAYALQEAAVAQKVRDAGYDAVIGHSKGKQGPFISEIFDIRESHYPNKFGDFQLNPKFEEMYQNTPRRQIIEQELEKVSK